MVELKVEACDICLDPSRAVRHWIIQVGDRSVQTALCEEHSYPVAQLLEQLQEAREGRSDGPTRQPGTRGASAVRKAQKGTQSRTGSIGKGRARKRASSVPDPIYPMTPEEIAKHRIKK